jgi:hypothetical protein
MRLRIFAIAVLAAALSGCWVFDELSEGNKKMDLYMKKKPDAEEADAPLARTGKHQRVGEYFANQKNPRTFTPGSLSEDIVKCKLKSGVQFMKQDQCASRGGVPGG